MVIELNTGGRDGYEEKIYLLPDDYFDERHMKVEVIDTRTNEVIYRIEADGTVEEPRNIHESGSRCEDFKKPLDKLYKSYMEGALPIDRYPPEKQQMLVKANAIFNVVFDNLNRPAGWDCFECRKEGFPKEPELKPYPIERLSRKYLDRATDADGLRAW